jgi:hypothetical protein
LPGYINTISSIASQIGSSMVLGGLGAGGTAALVNENKALTATAGLAASTNSAANAGTSNVGSNVVVGIYPGAGNTTLINWQVISANVPAASYVMITGGPGAPAGHLPLNSNITVNITTPTQYTLTIYDAKGNALGTTPINAFPSTSTDASSPQTYNANQNPNAPTVAGAFTNHPVFNLRGPDADLSLRGN